MMQLSAIARRRCARVCAATIAVVGVVSVSRLADAATWTWVGGGGSSNWNNNSNWLPIGTPAINANILVQQSSATITQNVVAGVTVAGIDIPGNATITGNPIRLSAGGTITTGGFQHSDLIAPIQLLGAGTIATQTANQ